MTEGIEETKSFHNISAQRENDNKLDPDWVPAESLPHELGRPSFSDSTNAPSKKFSPRVSSHAKKNSQNAAANRNLLDEDDSERQPSNQLMSSSNRTFHGGGTDGGASTRPISVDGVFLVSTQQDKEPPPFGGAEDSDDSDE